MPIETSAWYDPAWRKRKRIVLSRSHIHARLENFPLLVCLDNDHDLAAHARVDGHDILFTAADGVTKLPHQRVVHQKILREQAVWTIWSDPRAVRHVGKRDCTYVCYYTRNEGWWISAYDHGTHEWEHVELRSHAASAGGRWWDDHNNPALTVRKDGRIAVVYGEHSTSRSWCRISEQPEDISAWGEEIPFEQEQRHFQRRRWAITASWMLRRGVRKIRRLLRRPAGSPVVRDRPAYSYVNLYTLPDGTLWRHYRPLTTWSGLSRRPTFATSKDGGRTWSAPVRFIEQSGRTPYLVTAQEGDKIHFFFTEAHPDEWPRTSVYHAYYDHSDGTYRRSDGSLIGDHRALPLSPSQATCLYDGTTVRGEAWVHHVAVDPEGNIAGVFNVYAGAKEGLPSHRVHEYWYARWDGSGWTVNRITEEWDVLSAGQRRYSGGFVVDPQDAATVYVSLVDPEAEDGHHSRRIWRYQTADGGISWSKTCLSGVGKAHLRPVVPLNRHPELPVFWLYGHYVNYFEYHTGMVAADHGPHLDSQHYVRVPQLDPNADLVLYVYYDHPEASDQEGAFAEVWPAGCRLAYRGSLTQNDLRRDFTAAGDRITIELGAVWASDRRGSGSTPILSNRTGAGDGVAITKTEAGTLRIETQGGGMTHAQTFSDLALRTRFWRSAFERVRISSIQATLEVGKGVRAWLDGTQSAFVGDLTAPVGSGTTLRVGYSPDQSEDRFQGWVEWLRIYDEVLSDEWLTLSTLAETANQTLLAVSPQETMVEESGTDAH